MMSIVHPRLFVHIGKILPLRCTIRQHDGTLEDSGQPTKGDEHYQDVAGAVDIPCRRAPLIQERPTSYEQHSPHVVRSITKFHIMLAGYYPQIHSDHRAYIGQEVHNIVSVEHSGDNSVTRIRTEITGPRND
jgi:hypothetical protein